MQTIIAQIIKSHNFNIKGTYTDLLLYFLPNQIMVNPPPPPPDMPDVTDTGTVIGTIKPQQPPTQQQLEQPTPIKADDTRDDNAMDIDKEEEDDEPINEAEALSTIEKLRSDDLPSRIVAASKLTTIAKALGPQRTREELLPFIADGIDDDDEVLEVIAVSLGKLIPYIGTNENESYIKCLLQPLELLLAVEETVVREKASQSVLYISSTLSNITYNNEYIEMLNRLANKEWYTARISACGLIPLSYSKMNNDMQGKSIGNFVKLCNDDAPMVRRIASRNLGALFYSVVENGGLELLIGSGSSDCGENGEGGVVSSLLGLYELLASGDQPDSVRLHTTQNCVNFGEAMTLIKNKLSSSSSLSNNNPASPTAAEEESLSNIDKLVKRILPLVVATIDDRSWRVRWTAASKFASVVHAFSSLEGTMDALVPAYEKLLQDPEAEVRTAATFNLSQVAKTGALVYPAGWTEGSDISAGGNSMDDEQQRIPVANRLVKRVMQLTEDDSENVRAALAMVATDLAPVLGKDATIQHLLPPMLLLLRDSTSEVRLNIISSLSLLNDVIGPELLTQSLLPAILDLAEDGKWRIRLAVIERVPLLAKQLGKEFFTDRLLSLCVGWLGDDISSIREAAAKNLKELTSLLGSEWAVENLLPRVKSVMENSSYLRRMNAVQALSLMATAMDVKTAQWEILPIMLEMYCDPVPNVRFNVAKGLGMIGIMFGMSVYQGQIVPILTLMNEDQDRDVRYFATQAIDALSEHFSNSQ